MDLPGSGSGARYSGMSKMFAKISWTGIVSAQGITGQLCCLLVASSIGCATGAGLQDAQYCLAQKTRAEISWLTCNDWQERWDLGSDYGAGYKKGYYDASTGRGCKLPATPPPCYWGTKYQSCEGQQAIASWYRGYQCGAAAAQGEGYPSFNGVPTGPCAPSLNNTGCQGCYSPANCPCNEPIRSAPVDMGDSEHQFHAGLFGQYGSALAPQPSQASSESRNVAPDAPETTDPKSDSDEDKSASDSGSEEADSNA
jgi:hypothetical protein